MRGDLLLEIQAVELGTGDCSVKSPDHVFLHRAQLGGRRHDARGLCRSRIFTQDGRLVASTAQEGLIRLRKPQP